MSNAVTVPDTRPFPWKCGHCREKAVFPEQVADYAVEIAHDGRTYTVKLPVLETPRCRKCGKIVLDDAANRQISQAFRREAELLTPEQIRQGREALGLTQKRLASLLKIADATVSRWETGVQIQQSCLDRLLRLFFAFENVRVALAGPPDSIRPGSGELVPIKPPPANCPRDGGFRLRGQSRRKPANGASRCGRTPGNDFGQQQAE